jgi:predicted outer membrane protein
MLNLSKRLAVAGVIAGVALGPAVTSAPASTSHHNRGSHHHRGASGIRDISDAQFLAQAARANRFEIITGQLAQQRAASADVKALGAMFVADHTAALAKGAAVAAALGIPVPQDLSPAQQAQVDLLSRLSGRRFDRVWLKVQLAAHVKAIKLHLRGALFGDTQAVRDLAIDALPVVTRHLSELLQLRRGASTHQHG